MSSLWTVIEPKKISKVLCKLRQDARRTYDQMLIDLENEGPVPKGWNVKKIKSNTYRLWLNYRYRVVYEVEEYPSRILIRFVGHKKDVPY